MGDDSITESKGKGRIDLDHGSFNGVLYVPGIANNLLSVYQMSQIGSPKKVVFSPIDVEISYVLNGGVIAKGVVDYSSKVYKFSHFLPFSNPSSLITRANEERKIWHEIFGCLN